MSGKSPVTLPGPDLQIDFTGQTNEIRTLYLQEALSNTVEAMDVTKIDRELAIFAPKSSLAALARNGLRGELVFAVPCILKQNPRLLAYYRLLIGYSRKDFFDSRNGTGPFKNMEERGLLSKACEVSLPALCTALAINAALLVAGIGAPKLSSSLLHDLTMLTLGPQLRGQANVHKGKKGIGRVFAIILEMVKTHATAITDSKIELQNAAKRQIRIEVAPDPDITIREEFAPGDFRNVIAIEIKGGSDFSNIHNRIGEAEKSHQKARQKGYTECWTIVNVRQFDLKQLQNESPSTDRFYNLNNLGADGNEIADFQKRILSLTGLPTTMDRRRSRKSPTDK